MSTLMHRTIPFLLVFLISSCSPMISSPTPTTAPAQTAEMILESPGIQALELTGTRALPTATSTPEPPAELHAISTWPAEMQEFFNRLPEEWNNPTKQYISDVEFHRFIQQTRRDFLSANGVVDTESKTKDELLMEYLRWGNENKQILLLTPIEIRGWYADPENIGVAYKHILPNNSGV